MIIRFLVSLLTLLYALLNQRVSQTWLNKAQKYSKTGHTCFRQLIFSSFSERRQHPELVKYLLATLQSLIPESLVASCTSYHRTQRKQSGGIASPCSWSPLIFLEHHHHPSGQSKTSIIECLPEWLKELWYFDQWAPLLMRRSVNVICLGEFWKSSTCISFGKK